MRFLTDKSIVLVFISVLGVPLEVVVVVHMEHWRPNGFLLVLPVSEGERFAGHPVENSVVVGVQGGRRPASSQSRP